MKVNIISAGLHGHTGGPTKTIKSFKDALGSEVFSFCDPTLLKQYPLVVEGAVPIVVSRLPLLRQFRWSSCLSCKVAEESFKNSNLVSTHSFYRYHSVWVYRMSRKYNVPYWFVPHGVLDPWVMTYGKLFKGAYLKLWGERFLERAATVIFATSAEREKAASLFSLPESDVVPWPVDLVDISQRDEHRKRTRQNLKIPEDAKVLLYFGRIHSMKRPLETICAVAQVQSENVHLIIVGNSQDVSLKDCQKAAADAGIASRVHLIGPIYGDAKYHYIFAADAYISLSWRENFNHTAAESLAAGLPVILSPGNDIQSDIAKTGCSWALCDNRAVTASDAIEKFSTSDVETLRSMGARGRAWVKNNLSFEVFSNRINAIARKYARY